MAENNSNTNEADLRKGPWSIEEDMMLTKYVERNGEENWNAVQSNYGLLRCGKSCRLRWLNHLKPSLKKGTISAEEERTIVGLHALFGNNWAKIATQLPGRTDNEIKNFWNAKVRELERSGLPLYPSEVRARAEAYHQQQKELQFQQLQQILSSPSSAFADYPNHPGVLLPNQLTAANPLGNHPDPTTNYYTSPYPPPPPPLLQFEFSNQNGGDINIPLTLSPISAFGFSVSAFGSPISTFGFPVSAYGSHIAYGFPVSAYGSHVFAYGFPVSASSTPVNPSFAYVTGSASKISATITTTATGSVTPVSSNASEVDGWFKATGNMANDYYEFAAPFPSPPLTRNTSLLGDLVLDVENPSLNNKGNNIMAEEGNNNTMKKNNAEATNENQSNELGNFHFRPGANPIGVYLEEMNDYDDLLSMINFSVDPADHELSLLFGGSMNDNDVSDIC